MRMHSYESAIVRFYFREGRYVIITKDVITPFWLFIHSLALCLCNVNLKKEALSIYNYFLLYLKSLPLSAGGEGKGEGVYKKE